MMIYRCGYCNRFECQCPDKIMVKQGRSIRGWINPNPVGPPLLPPAIHGGNTRDTHYNPRTAKHGRKLRPL